MGSFQDNISNIFPWASGGRGKGGGKCPGIRDQQGVRHRGAHGSRISEKDFNNLKSDGCRFKKNNNNFT